MSDFEKNENVIEETATTTEAVEETQEIREEAPQDVAPEPTETAEPETGEAPQDAASESEETPAPETPVPEVPAKPVKRKHPLRTVLIVLLALALSAALLLHFSVKARIVGLSCLQLGKPYIFGDVGPDSFDCSGLTSYVYRNAAGIELGRTASMQGYDNHYEKLAKPEELKIGDLAFFNTVRDNDRCDHVGIYIGFGRFLHASSKKEKVVISSLDEEYYRNAYTWGRRIL